MLHSDRTFQREMFILFESDVLNTDTFERIDIFLSELFEHNLYIRLYHTGITGTPPLIVPTEVREIEVVITVIYQITGKSGSY